MPPSSKRKRHPPGPNQIDPQTGRRICGALKGDGNICRSPGLANGRCKFHGGKQEVGVESHATRHGRYSEFMPPRLLERYQRSEQDPELLGLRADVALLQTRIMDLTERLYTGESGSLWQRLKKSWDAYQRDTAKAQFEPDQEKKARLLLAAQAALDEVGLAIGCGCEDENNWRELAKAVKDKTAVATAEHKRLVELNQVITAEKALVFAMSIMDIVMRHTPEPERRQVIAREIRTIVDAAPQGKNGRAQLANSPATADLAPEPDADGRLPDARTTRKKRPPQGPATP